MVTRQPLGKLQWLVGPDSETNLKIDDAVLMLLVSQVADQGKNQGSKKIRNEPSFKTDDQIAPGDQIENLIFAFWSPIWSPGAIWSPIWSPEH